MYCYLDESGTNRDSQTAVVAGVCVDSEAAFWLDVEWEKLLNRHKVVPPLHMREFGKHGRFKHFDESQRKALFSDVARIINEYKVASVAAALTVDEYRRCFSDLFDERHGLSVYGSCFLLFAMVVHARAQLDNYTDPFSYILDSGNQYKGHVLDGHKEYRKLYPHNVGALRFECDTQVRILQCADVVAWTVRRRLSLELLHSFEPLLDIIDQKHIEAPYKEEWMQSVAQTLRDKIGTSLHSRDSVSTSSGSTTGS